MKAVPHWHPAFDPAMKLLDILANQPEGVSRNTATGCRRMVELARVNWYIEEKAFVHILRCAQEISAKTRISYNELEKLAMDAGEIIDSTADAHAAAGRYVHALKK